MLALHKNMLVRYCAAHPGHFGYPRLLGVRWNGWRVATAGGLCEACRERERPRWDSSPYGEVLIPVPVELGPRWFGRRVIVVIVAGLASAVLTTTALLVVNPPDLIPSGGEPGYVSSGARLAGPAQAQAEPETERSAASRPLPSVRAVSSVEVPRVVPPRKRPGRAASIMPVTTVSYARACAVAAAPPPRARFARTIAGVESP